MKKKMGGTGEGGCSHFTESVAFHSGVVILIKPHCKSAVLAGSNPTAAVQERLATTPTSVLRPEEYHKTSEKIGWKPLNCGSSKNAPLRSHLTPIFRSQTSVEPPSCDYLEKNI